MNNAGSHGVIGASGTAHGALGSHGPISPASGDAAGGESHHDVHFHDIGHHLSQTTTVVPVASDVPSVYLKLLDILSPTKLSFFLFLFGFIGYFALKVLPGYFSLAPAIVLGWFLANAFFNILGTILLRIGTSTNFTKESQIGALGQLTLSIDNGGLGEVMIASKGSRYSSPARPYQEGQTIKKLAQVVVVDIKDGIFLVEPFDDEDMAPASITGESKKER